MITDFITYLGFDGNCEEAFKFYEKALGGKITALFYYKDAPNNQHDAYSDNKVMHVTLQVGNRFIQGGDAPNGQFGGHSGYCVNIAVDDSIDADKIFTSISEGGRITMPIGETFWAYRFGMLIDKFGVPWMINHNKPMQ